MSAPVEQVQPPQFSISDTALEGRWYLRPKDVERLTGLKTTTIRDAIYRGELEARKFRGRGWLITVDAARRWIEEQTVSNRPEENERKTSDGAAYITEHPSAATGGCSRSFGREPHTPYILSAFEQRTSLEHSKRPGRPAHSSNTSPERLLGARRAALSLSYGRPC